MTPVDDLARNLAVRSPRGGAVDGVRPTADDLVFERAARALATPMPRRRALRLVAGAAAVVLFRLPTGRARAQGGLLPCPPQENPTFTQPCGLSSCCHPTAQCCPPTDEGFVNCCYPADGYMCGPPDPRTRRPSCICRNRPCGGDCCKDEQDCVMGDRSSPETDFCAPRCPPGLVHCPGAGSCCARNEACCGEGCCGSGRCCERNGDHWCCAQTMACGEFAGTCRCLSGQRCGSGCCPAGSECCRFSVVVSLLGRVRIRYARYSCCSPGMEKRLRDFGNDLINFTPLSGGAFGAEASARAARRRRGRVAAAAVPADALVALGAVGNLAALAGDRLRSGRPDSRYRRPVSVRKPALAPIAPGSGLEAPAVTALDKLLSAEARAWALVNAMAVAHSRSLGAIRAGNVRAARSQALASRRFAAQAARALRPVPGLRTAAVAALQRAGTAEVTVTARQVAGFQTSVRGGGLPADMRTRLTQLGLDGSEQRSVAALMLARQPESAAGDVLIAPLADASRLARIAELAKLLARQAAHSRKHPFTVSNVGPRTVDGTTPRLHASQSSPRRPR